MNPRRNAIEAMYAYHEAYKGGRTFDPKQVEDSIKELSESDRNFMLVTAKMKNIEDMYPVSDGLSNQYTLADLIMAYRYYLKEKQAMDKDSELIDEVDVFYRNGK